MNDRLASINSAPGNPVVMRSTVDLLALIWRRRALIGTAVLVSIALGFCYWLWADRIYVSSADVLVVSKQAPAVTGDSGYDSGFEDYLATHLALIVSPMIVERAIEQSNLAELPSFVDYADDPDIHLADIIIEQLQVESGSRELGDNADSIMTLSFYGNIPEDCPLVVEAILKSYESTHREIYHGMSDTTVGLITQARDLLNHDLQQQEDAYGQFRQSSPLIARGTEEINPLQDRLTAIETQRSELLLRRAEVERQLLAVEKSLQSGNNYEKMLAIVSDLRHLSSTENGLPNTSTTLENQLIQLVDTEQRLLEHFGPNHPHVAIIRERIAATRRFFALPTAAYMEQAAAADDDETLISNSDPVETYINYLKQELERIELSATILSDLYQREHEAAKELSGYELRDEAFQRNIDRSEQLYNIVVNRLQEASLTKDFEGFETRVIAPPRLGEKVSPRGSIVLPVFAFAGACIGFMLGIYAEFADRSFHSREEIEQLLQVPVVGQIPQFVALEDDRGRDGREQSPNEAGQLDPLLWTYHQPRTVETEAFRALRTAITLRTRDQASRVIQVSAPTSPEGTTLLAANLAISLAQTGKKVLLIDADLRTPRQHELFGIPTPANGLVSVVMQDEEPADGTYPTAVANLWLMPAGPLPECPCEPFSTPRFANLINLVGEQYDFVLLDTPPLLTVSDSCAIAARVDGLLLTLRLDEQTRARAQRAAKLLETLELKLMGVIVNAVGGRDAGSYQSDLYDNHDDKYFQSRLLPPVEAPTEVSA